MSSLLEARAGIPDASSGWSRHSYTYQPHRWLTRRLVGIKDVESVDEDRHLHIPAQPELLLQPQIEDRTVRILPRASGLEEHRCAVVVIEPSTETYGVQYSPVRYW